VLVKGPDSVYQAAMLEGEVEQAVEEGHIEGPEVKNLDNGSIAERGELRLLEPKMSAEGAL